MIRFSCCRECYTCIPRILFILFTRKEYHLKITMSLNPDNYRGFPGTPARFLPFYSIGLYYSMGIMRLSGLKNRVLKKDGYLLDRVFQSDTIAHENPMIFAAVIGTLNTEFENKNASLQNGANLAGRGMAGNERWIKISSLVDPGHVRIFHFAREISCSRVPDRYKKTTVLKAV